MPVRTCAALTAIMLHWPCGERTHAYNEEDDMKNWKCVETFMQKHCGARPKDESDEVYMWPYSQDVLVAHYKESPEIQYVFSCALCTVAYGECSSKHWQPQTPKGSEATFHEICANMFRGMPAPTKICF